MFFIESSEVCICTKGGGKLEYRDKVKRILKGEGGKSLVSMNNIKDPDRISIGQVLKY